MGNSVRKLSGSSSLKRNKSEGQLSTNILQKDQYRLLAETLTGKQEKVHCDILKRLGSVILHQDISVAKLALDNEKSNFPKTARRIQRKEIARDGKIPDKLKIGRFSKKEDSVIIQNWQELLKKANLENQSNETIQNSVFNPSNISKENQNQAEIQMIKNLIGYWLSMGLTHTRLSCEVFQRLNVLSNTTGGEFSAEEDKLVIQYVQQNGRNGRNSPR